MNKFNAAASIVLASLTLTACPIGEGDPSFYDDFSSGTFSPAWTGTIAGSHFDDGKLVVRPSIDRVDEANVVTVASYGNFIFEADVTVVQHSAGIVFHFNDNGNKYMWQLNTWQNKLRPHVFENGSPRLISGAETEYDFEENQMYKVRIEANNALVTTYIDGEKISEVEDGTFTSGAIGFREAAIRNSNFGAEENKEIAIIDNVSIWEK